MSEVAEKRRTAMPVTAATLAMARAIFGPQCEVVWAEENGLKFRERTPPGITVATPWTKKK